MYRKSKLTFAQWQKKSLAAIETMHSIKND